MNTRIVSIACLLLYALTAVSAPAQKSTLSSRASAAEPADLILLNGQIYTPNGWEAALAIRNGVIIALGSESAVAPFRAPKTRVIDLHGDTVTPGLHDMHVHPSSGGIQQLTCNFPQGASPQQVLDTVKGCVAKRAKGEWITGGQWDTASFGEKRVHKSMLDSVSPDNPVVLSDISMHSVWANSRALQLSKITRETPDPPGGIIEKDQKGEPSGVLRESAAGIVRAAVPPYTKEQNAQAMQWALSEMLSYGITAFTDAVVDENNMKVYADLADKGILKQRVRGCILWSPSDSAGNQKLTNEAIERRNLYERARFKPDCVKIIIDGVPTAGHTAAMVEPYADTANMDSARARGMLLVSPQTLNAAVAAFDARGLTVKIHTAGDAAVRAGLNAIEFARKANGFSGSLHSVGHNSFVQPGDLGRAKDIQAVFEMSPYIWYPNPIIPDIAKAVGPERMKRWTPVKEAIDSGTLVVAGSDWNVVPSVNPWIAIETLVTRQMPGGGGETLAESEKITLQQAFDLFTGNAARQMGTRNRTGSIERGQAADLIVLDRNPFKIPVTQIHQTKVKLVMINGEIVREVRGNTR